MLLTRSNKVLGIASISKGGISGTVTDVRIILCKQQLTMHRKWQIGVHRF
jgi:hypothetical protein